MSDEVQVFECKCLVQDAGREEGDVGSPLLRDPQGNLRIVDIGSLSYLHLGKGEEPGDWISLYQVPNGHGSTYLGYFVSVNFEIKPMSSI